MKIVIIEDERLTAKDLATTIRSVEPDAEILPFLYSVEEAIFFLEQKPTIDLIFADIQLGDGLSFDIFKKIKNQVPVIFCTAYDQYSLEAFKNAGIDYILKPFSKLSVEQTLVKYKNLKDIFSASAPITAAAFHSAGSQTSSVIIQQGDKIIPIHIGQIALFFTKNNLTFAFTFEQAKYMVHENLDLLEEKYALKFFRCNRQFLVNRKVVKDASRYFNRKLLVNLIIPFNEQILVSKLKAGQFISWLASC
jgi:two-component system, LytTR family, response regulator LytT